MPQVATRSFHAVPKPDELGLVRNIGIMAHIDAGKTTATERILYYTGQAPTRSARSTRARPPWTGWPRSRSAASRSRPPRRPRSGTTIASTSSIRPGTWTSPSRSSARLRVLDGAVAVFDAVAGVQPQSETVWRQADKYAVPRIAFINKMDRVGADFFYLVQTMVDRLGAHARCRSSCRSAPRTASRASSTSSSARRPRYTDSLGDDVGGGRDPGRARRLGRRLPPRPDRGRRRPRRRHHAMAFLEDEPIDAARAARPRSAPRTLDLSITPVLCGSAFKNKGVQPLLDAIIDYLPTPLDIPPVDGVDPNERRGVARSRPSTSRSAALAFKVMTDPYVGKLTYFRVYSGQLKAGSHDLQRDERQARSASAASSRCTPTSARSASRSAPARSPPPSASSSATTGDTLCDPANPILLENDRVPRAGDRGRRRAQDEGRPGQARGRARPPLRGGPDLPREDRTRRPARR